MEAAFTKIVRLGTKPVWSGSESRVSVFAEIKYQDGKLSISGVEGPLPSGNARGACGQIVMHLREKGALADFRPAPGWTAHNVRHFLSVWDRWHLNDMKAGSPAQEKFLRENPVDAKYPASHYDVASAALAAAGLNPDAGYEYGSKWLKEKIPDDVLVWLKALPDADKKPAWV